MIILFIRKLLKYNCLQKTFINLIHEMKSNPAVKRRNETNRKEIDKIKIWNIRRDELHKSEARRILSLDEKEISCKFRTRFAAWEKISAKKYLVEKPGRVEKKRR